MESKRRRKHMRLEGYDYSQNGYYFVTICVWSHSQWFENICNEKMILNKIGIVIKKCWFDLPDHYPNCSLDEFIIMPNHIHGIVIIDNDVGAGLKPAPTYPVKRYSLSEIIRGFKIFSSREINKQNSHIRFRWQRSFYDHIIRNDSSLCDTRQYVRNNPAKWQLDRNHPNNL